MLPITFQCVGKFGFQVDLFIYTYIDDRIYAEFRLARNSTVRGLP
jgi:hypothetical protein